MTHIIVCAGLFDSEDKLIGPIHASHAEEYLPKYREQEFANKIDGIKWISENHRGADYNGIIANFSVVSR